MARRCSCRNAQDHAFAYASPLPAAPSDKTLPLCERFAYSGAVVNRLPPPAVSRRTLVGLAAGAAGAAFASSRPAAAAAMPAAAGRLASRSCAARLAARRRRRARRSGQRDLGADRHRHRRGHADGTGARREAWRPPARPPRLARRHRSRSRRRRDGDVHRSGGEGGAAGARRLGLRAHPAASRLRRHQRATRRS